MLINEMEVRNVYRAAARRYYDHFPTIKNFQGAEIHFVEDHKVNKNIIEGTKITWLAINSDPNSNIPPVMPVLFKKGPLYVWLMEDTILPLQFKGNTIITTNDDDYKIYYTNLHQLCGFFDILFSYGVDVIQPIGMYANKERLDSRIEMMRRWGVNANKYNISK